MTNKFSFCLLLALFSISFLFNLTLSAKPDKLPVYPLPLIRDTLKDSDTSQTTFSLDTSLLGSFYFPIRGKVISHFGFRGRRMHTGTDIKLSHGDTVRAAFTGVITKASKFYGYGNLVVIQHPGNIETYYAHLSKTLVNPGDVISNGTPLGLGGRTGRATTDHLHFEIRDNGKALNAEYFFDFNECSIKSLAIGRKEAPVREKRALVSREKEIHYHTIKKGDTLFSMSKKYATTVKRICKLNGIKKSSVLKVGQKVRVI